MSATFLSADLFRELLNLFDKVESGVEGWDEAPWAINLCVPALINCHFIFSISNTWLSSIMIHSVHCGTTTTRVLFIHGKAMVPYMQLSTYLRIGFWYNEKKLYSHNIIKPTFGWQLHIRYHGIPVYKEFPATTTTTTTVSTSTIITTSF